MNVPLHQYSPCGCAFDREQHVDNFQNAGVARLADLNHDLWVLDVAEVTAGPHNLAHKYQ